MLEKLQRLFDGKELAPTITTIPPEGEYISVVADAYTTEISPVGNTKELAHVIEYRLISLTDYQHYSFFETISPYKSTPRTEAFVDTLESYGLTFFPDDDILGLTEKIQIVYDFLNGYAIPVISERKRMSINDYTEIMDDEDLPF